MDEERTTEFSGDESTFYTKDSGNIFGVAFDRLFKMDKLNVYNEFELTSKRNFRNLAPTILETYQELFLMDDGEFNEETALIFFNILNAKWKITVNSSDGKSTSYEEFIAMLDKIINDGNSLLIKKIGNFVEANYQLDLDKITQETRDKKKKVNEELQFSDAHAKDLLKIAYLYRVMIPLVSVYFVYNKNNLLSVPLTDDGTEPKSEDNSEELELEEVNSKIFAYLFEHFATKPTALRNKLYKLTYSRISKTAYSDKRFWTAAKNVGITKETEALDIYKKLLTNAIPKLLIQKDRNVISFLQSVVNNQIDFLFQNKFKHKLVPLTIEGNNKYSTEDEDDDDVSEFEKMELLTTRRDEGSYIIRKLNINDVVPKIPEKFKVGVDDSEVRALMKTLSRNSIQEGIVSMLTFKYFNDKDALKYISFYQYCYLVVACKKFLIEKKFKYLPKILTATCEKHKERTGIVGKKVRPDILNSKKYTDMFRDKYVNFASEIEGPFLSIIGTTYSSVFKDENGVELFDGTVKVAKIAEEVLDLAKLT